MVDVSIGNLKTEMLSTHRDGMGITNGRTDPHLTHGAGSWDGDLPHSYFPCLDSRPGAGKTWQGTEVPYNDINLLHARCKHHSIDPVSVFQAAWALVLNCYLGDQHVCFAFDCIQERHHTNKFDQSNSSISWGQAHLGQCTTSLDLLRHVHIRSKRLLPHSANAFVGYGSDSRRLKLPANTCLLYRKSNQEVWLGLEESTLEQRVDQGYDVWPLERFDEIVLSWYSSRLLLMPKSDRTIFFLAFTISVPIYQLCQLRM